MSASGRSREKTLQSASVLAAIRSVVSPVNVPTSNIFLGFLAEQIALKQSKSGRGRTMSLGRKICDGNIFSQSSFRPQRSFKEMPGNVNDAWDAVEASNFLLCAGRRSRRIIRLITGHPGRKKVSGFGEMAWMRRFLANCSSWGTNSN